MAAAAKARKARVPADPPAMVPVPVIPADAVKPEIAAVSPSYSFYLFEWMTALMMIGVALVVTISPKSVQFGGFYLMAEIGLTPGVLGIVYMAAGLGRIAALIANGASLVYGPAMRGAGALVGLAVWLQMLYALILWSLKTNGFLSIGVSVYLFLAIGEGISCYRAAADVRTKHR